MNRRLVAIAVGVIAAGVGIALWAFQPWKLWVDDKVDEAAPAGARPLMIASAPPAGTQFVGIDHGTSGTLLFLHDDAGRRFVRLEDLDTSNGPDLFVYLSANPLDGEEGAFDDDYVNLGRLQGNIGSQNYELPADVDPGRYASVVIWCDRFNSAFGAAPLT